MDFQILNKGFQEFIDSASGVTDFELIPEYPYFRSIGRDDGNGLGKNELIALFTVKISEFFKKCREIKTGFIKNRRYRSVVINTQSLVNKLLIGIHKKRLIYLSEFLPESSSVNNPESKFNRDASSGSKISKLDLVSSRIFSVFGDQNSFIMKITGWTKIEKQFYFVFEYLDTTFEYFITTTDWTSELIENFRNQILKGSEYLKSKKLYLGQSSVFVRGAELVFPLHFLGSNEEFHNEQINLILENLNNIKPVS